MEDKHSIEHKNSILLIDDSPDTGLLIRQSLGTRGYRVLTASNPKDGLRLFQENPDIRLILIDIHLDADINGIALAKQFNELKATRIFSMCFVSGARVDQSFIDAAVKIGVEGFIAKPINQDRLLSKVEDLLGISLDALAQSPKIKCHLAAELVHIAIIPVLRIIQISQNSFLIMSSADFVVGTILNLHCPALQTIMNERYFTIKVLRTKPNSRQIERDLPFIARCQIIELNHNVRLALDALFASNAVLPDGLELVVETPAAVQGLS